MASTPLVAVTMGTGFTYQGRFMDGGNPADDTYDFEFKLYDALTGGSQQGSTVHSGDVDVEDGYFTVELDFGSSVFGGDARWLQIGVRPGESAGAYTTLAPRQEVTPGPYSLYAEHTAGITAASGNVGIGTSSPSAKLHISGGSVRIDGPAVPMIVRETDQSLPSGLWRLVADGGQCRIDRNTAGAGNFSTYQSSFTIVPGEKILLLDGNVGIGTTDPGNAKLLVNGGSAGTAPNIRTNGDVVIGSGGAIFFDGVHYYGDGSYIIPSGGSDTQGFFANGVERMRITSGGNIGVGTSAPSEKLDVSGDVRCVDLVETSDEQLKTDVQPLGSVLDKLDQVRAVSFRWNERARSIGAGTDAKQVGVLAQELEQVFPGK